MDVALFYSSLLVMGLVAVILGIVNIVRLTEIHRLVNSNSTAQRVEIGEQRDAIASLNAKLTEALVHVGRVEGRRDRLQKPLEGEVS
jgi:hypothetical protein